VLGIEAAETPAPARASRESNEGIMATNSECLSTQTESYSRKLAVFEPEIRKEFGSISMSSKSHSNKLSRSS
jgi:hypothetical protein